MTAPDPLYVLRVQGLLDDHGAGRLDGLALDRKERRHHEPHRPDHRPAHLHGVLTKFRDLGVTLIAVTPAGSPQTTTEKE